MTDRNRNDIDELLGELRGALNVEPSPEFEARVRERVAGETTSTTRWWWMGAAAVAATAIVMAMVMPRSGEVSERMPVETARVERPAPPVGSSALTEHVRAAPERPAARATARRRTTRVIVQPGEDRALQQLVNALWTGTVTSAPTINGKADPIEIPALKAPALIQVSAIRIDPIDLEF